MNWPEGTKYHVHEFRLDKTGSAFEASHFFRSSLTVRDSEGPLYRFRKSSAKHWWFVDGTTWWFKAHDRTFDCETAWAGIGLRATA